VKFELTDREWDAWADRRPHFEPRRAFWFQIMTGASAALNFYLAGVNLLLGMSERGNGWHIFAVVMCLLVAGLNGVMWLRYLGAWRNARIRARTPIPSELQDAFLRLRVMHYIDESRERRRRWDAVRRSLSSIRR
jgi:hypothetical protein